MKSRLTVLDRILLRLSPALRRAVAGTPSLVNSGPSRGGVSLKDDDTYVAEAYKCIAALYAGVFAIAHSVAQVPIDVYRIRKSGTLEVITDHEITRLLDPERGKANPFFPAYDIHEETQSFLELAGNGFWHLAGGRALLGGVPEQIYSLRPDRMKVVAAEKGQPISHYEYDLGNGRKQRLDVKEVVHFRYFNPASQIIGQSSGEAVREEILIEVFAKSMNKLFFKNGATLSGVLEVEDALETPEARAILEQFTDNHSGFWNSFKVRLLSGGAKYNAVQPAHKDMLFYEGLKWTREQILMSLGVPPIMVTLPDVATFNNAREQKQGFWENTAIPKIRKRDATLNLQLVPRWGPGLVLKSNLSNIEALQASLKDLVEPLEVLQRMGSLSRNEVRLWVKTRQMPDLKPLPDGDDYYLPIGMISTDREDLPATDPVAPPASADEPVVTDEKSVNAFLASMTREGRRLEEERRRARTRAKADTMARRVEAHAPIYARAIKTVFKAQERVLLENVDRLARSARPLEAANRGLDDIDDLFNAMRSANSKRIEQAMNKLVKEFGDAALTDLGLEATEVGFNMVNERVLSYLSNTAASKVKLIDETTAGTVRAEIQKAMLQAQLEGANIVDTAGAIMKAGIESGMEIRRARANAIAQTETTGAFNFSDAEAWIQSDVVETKVWRANDDEHTRDSHLAADGQEVNITQPFNVNGQSLMHPGDPAGSAAEVVNCRCHMEPGEFKKGYRPPDQRDHLREICAKLNVTPT
jgi:HK97 family phage portal protein